MFSTSHRILTTIACTIAATAALAGTAQAQWLMNKREAVAFARSDITARYIKLDLGPDRNVHITCRPSRYTTLNEHKGRRWHRWVCTWNVVTPTEQACDGRVLIVGSAKDVNNTYGRATIRGPRCSV